MSKPKPLIVEVMLLIVWIITNPKEFILLPIRQSYLGGNRHDF